MLAELPELSQEIKKLRHEILRPAQEANIFFLSWLRKLEKCYLSWLKEILKMLPEFALYSKKVLPELAQEP